MRTMDRGTCIELLEDDAGGRIGEACAELDAATRRVVTPIVSGGGRGGGGGRCEIDPI